MWTPKKINAGEQIRYIPVNRGNILGIETFWKTSGWALVDETGNYRTWTDRLTGRQNYELYNTKTAAQKSADYYNGRSK